MVPVTFHYDFAALGERERQTVLYEFAANGARHLTLTDALLDTVAGTPAMYRELRREMERAGLTFVDAHASFGHDCDIGCPDPAARRFMLAHLQLELQIVRDFDVTSCCLHVCSAFDRNFTLRQHLDAACRSLEVLLPLAEKLRLTLCLENIYRPCNSTTELLYLFDRFPSKHLGACFDSGHARLMEAGRDLPRCVGRDSYLAAGLTPRWESDVLAELLPHLVSCHLHDNDGVSDLHILPGKGGIDWKHMIPRLLTAPRLACVQCEVVPRRVQQPIRPLCETMHDLLGAL